MLEIIWILKRLDRISLTYYRNIYEFFSKLFLLKLNWSCHPQEIERPWKQECRNVPGFQDFPKKLK